MTTDKPFSLGVNGHAKACDCEPCAKARAARTARLWEENGSYAEPKTLDATIFVRSHFRRQSNHLRKYPNTRRFVRRLIASIRKDQRR